MLLRQRGRSRWTGLITPAVALPRALVIATICASPSLVLTHGDLHEQIAQATRALAVSPRDATLYLARGELYRAHRETDPALADYAMALRLQPGLLAVHLARGRLLLEAGRTADALRDLDHFLARQSAHPVARAVRARAHAALGHAAAAVADYDAALADAPNPDWYLARADLLRNLPGHGAGAALRGLDEGLARLGPVVTLTLAAIECEMALGRHDAALTRLDRFSTAGRPNPEWLVRRGDILRAAGRPHDARAAYRDALTVVDALPPARQRTRQTEALRQRARSGLQQSDMSGTHR